MTPRASTPVWQSPAAGFTSDMMAFVEGRVGAIIRETGAAVVVVHHTNKQGTERGSSSLKAGEDFTLRVERKGDLRSLVAEKVKDDAEGPLFDFRLEMVELGADCHGDLIKSCLVVKSDPAKIDRDKRCLANCEFLFAEAANETPPRNLSPKPRAGNYAAKWMHDQAPDHSVADFEAAIIRLTEMQKLTTETYRPGGTSGPTAVRFALSSGSVAVSGQ